MQSLKSKCAVWCSSIHLVFCINLLLIQFGIVPIECHPLVRYMLFFSSKQHFQLNSIQQLTLHCSVIVSSIVISLLISLQVLNFSMRSRTGPCQKLSQSSFSAHLPWFMNVYAEHCHGPVFKHEYPSSTRFKRNRSSFCKVMELKCVSIRVLLW